MAGHLMPLRALATHGPCSLSVDGAARREPELRGLSNVIIVAPRRGEHARGVIVYRARRARYAVDTERYAVRITLEDAQYTIVTPGTRAQSWVSPTAGELALVALENRSGESCFEGASTTPDRGVASPLLDRARARNRARNRSAPRTG